MKTIQEMVELLKTHGIAKDIDFHFQITAGHYLRDNFCFEPVSMEESHKYDKLCEVSKRVFKSQTSYICLPDISLEDFAINLKNRLYDIFLNHKILVYISLHKSDDGRQLAEKLDRLIILSMILHEIGHWEDFKKCDCMLYVMMEERNKYYSPANENIRDLQKIEAFLTTEEVKIAHFAHIYHNYMEGIEKTANEYAVSTLKKIYPMISSAI